MLKHKRASFAAVVVLWTLVTLLIKLIRVLPKWNSTRQKQLCHFGRHVAEAKLFCVKSFVQVTHATTTIYWYSHIKMVLPKIITNTRLITLN